MRYLRGIREIAVKQQNVILTPILAFARKHGGKNLTKSIYYKTLRFAQGDKKGYFSNAYCKLSVIFFVFMIAIWFSRASSAEKFIEPAKQDKCPVCGMFVYKYPNWVAQIIFKDGLYAVFDGPKDMFKYYFNISKYGKNKAKVDIAKIYATEYYTTEKVEAKDVYFVVGSDVYGPMGEELVPVKGRKEAETFTREHNGRKILGFEQITPADIPGAMKMQEMQEHDKRH